MNTLAKILKLLTVVTLSLIVVSCAGIQSEPTPTPTLTSTATRPAPTATPTATPTAAPTETPKPSPTPMPPSVSIAPTSGPPGTEIEVTVKGFPPDKGIQLGVEQEGGGSGIAYSERTGDTGHLTTTLAIPTYAEPEQRWMVTAATGEPLLEATSNVFTLPAAGGRDAAALAGDRAGGLRLRGQGQPLHHAYEEAQGPGGAGGDVYEPH